MSPRRRRRASPEWEGREIITVAALPGRGLYVRHLGHPEGVDGVHRPTVPPPGAAPRPPASFEAGWLQRNLDDVDVVHVHGLSPRLTAQDVSTAVEMTKTAGRPLVFTAYHLSDPGGNQEQFGAQLDALIPRSDAVVTLTTGAAEEIRRRWGVEALVVPPPHAVDFVRMRRARQANPHGSFTVGAHLGSLRMPADPVEVVTALGQAVKEVPDARLSVHLHEHLLDPDSTRYKPGVIADIERVVSGAGGTLRAHRPMTDAQLWDHLFGLDVSVLPPFAGSHSIWPEACFDLGTQVLIPAESHAAQQRPSLSYRTGKDGVPTVDSLRTALLAARSQGSPWRADPTDRWKERVKISETLRALYERLLGTTR